MKKIFSLMSAALVSLAMNAGLRTAGEVIECKLYSTNFQNWESVPSSATPSTKTVTTRYSNEELTFTFAETQIAPDGTNSKFTADVITTGYAMAAKTATPYIQTSALANVTKVHFVHAATGGSRGWGLQYKTAEDADWVTVSNSYCEQAGTAKDVTINKENVQLRWYNLNSSQNAYMTEFAIYGMAEDDGMPTEYTITYYDQNGNRLGDSVQNETQTLAFAFSAADLTIPEGYKFRGWYDSDKKRHVEGEALTADLRLNAMVTPIEVAEVGKYYVYDLTKNYFYEDDHECFIPANGAYHNEHGWHFAANGTISLPVAGKAYVKIGLCKWSDEANVTVTTKGGENVTTFPSKVETDNTVESFFYDGNADTIVMTFGAQAYIHSVAVYNVQAKAEKGTHGYYEIAGGDVAAFLMVLDQLQAGDKIFLHNGLYDLGDKVLTLISKNNVSIIGQSMEGVIIKNAPDVKAESIDKTATLKINDNISGTYLQDLTIQNALNYYKANNGRAVCLQDRGTKTICKNVRLLSYQDTYYSNKQGAVKYFEDCEIHGTVDFICGDGSVYFKNNLLYAEQRPSNTNALTASNAAASDKGFVFESCRVQSETAFSFGRLWGNAPQCVFLNTIIEKPSDLLNPHWTAQTINAGAWPGQAGYVGEFNTKDAENNVLTPASHQVTFKDGSSTRDYETVLSAEVAATFTMEYTLGDWSATAAADATQAVCEETAAEFEPNGIYLVEAEGEPAAIILGSEFMDRFALYNGVNYTIRKANARGGFGKSAGNESGEDIENTNVCNTQTLKLIRDGQIVIVRDNKEYNVLGAQL